MSNYKVWDLYSLGQRIVEWRARADAAKSEHQRRSYEGELKVLEREFNERVERIVAETLNILERDYDIEGVEDLGMPTVQEIAARISRVVLQGDTGETLENTI